MVVVVIIGLLAGAVTVSVRSYMAAAKRNTAKMEIVNIANAIDMYYDLEKSGYPTQDQGLEVLLKPSNNMIEGYLKTKKLTDPWGYPYQYFIPGPENAPFEVVSFGADRKEGGSGEAQDISSLDLKEDSP
jgi:general secretion pathway protein G